jgi:hypothetical protein
MYFVLRCSFVGFFYVPGESLNDAFRCGRRMFLIDWSPARRGMIVASFQTKPGSPAV